MAKPTTKRELLTDIERERQALESILATIGPDQMTQANVIGPWSIKDVLAHLIAWHQLCIGWYMMGVHDTTTTVPAEGFTWRQLPQLNQQIYERYRDQDLNRIVDQFRISCQEIVQFVEKLSEEELFTPNIYSWTGKHALISFITPNTSEHYHWARQGIRKGLKHPPKSSYMSDTGATADADPNP